MPDKSTAIVIITEEELSRLVAKAWVEINDHFHRQVMACTEAADADGVSRLLDQHYRFNLEFRHAASTLAAAATIQIWRTKLGIEKPR